MLGLLTGGPPPPIGGGWLNPMGGGPPAPGQSPVGGGINCGTVVENESGFKTDSEAILLPLAPAEAKTLQNILRGARNRTLRM